MTDDHDESEEIEDIPLADTDGFQTITDDITAILALDVVEEGFDPTETVLSRFEDDESDFLDRIQRTDDRYAPYKDEMVNAIEYDSSGVDADSQWPFNLNSSSDEAGEDQ